MVLCFVIYIYYFIVIIEVVLSGYYRFYVIVVGVKG